MVELVVDGLKGCAQIGKVHDPSVVLIHFAAQLNLDAKRMTMEARALVPCRHMRQSMGRFDGEFAVEVQTGLPNQSGWGLNSRSAPNPDWRRTRDKRQAALRRRELEAQLQVPHVQRMLEQSPHTVKSTEPKWRRHCSQYGLRRFARALR